MLALYLVGTSTGFCSCRALCQVSTSEVKLFFFRFIDAMVDMKDEYISLPWNLTELNRVNSFYNAVGLPGCIGSMDVVHVKWANCSTGDYNHAKGKEGFPGLAFECITDYNCRVLGVYGSLFGSRNDKDIVKTDVNINAMRSNRLFRDAQFRYYDEAGCIRTDKRRGSITAFSPF
jgi:hypothetical protein